METDKELELARKRVAELESEKVIWENDAIERIPPEVLAQHINRQQLETLTYHLLDSQKKLTEFQKNLTKAESELNAEKSKNTVLEGKLELSQEIISKLKKVAELQKSSGAIQGQRAGVADVPSEDELRDIIGSRGKPNSSGSGSPKTIRDFIQLMSRIKRVKLLDAAILLSVSPDTVSTWSKKLASKKYITIKGSGREDTMFLASDKLRK